MNYDYVVAPFRFKSEKLDDDVKSSACESEVSMEKFHIHGDGHDNDLFGSL